MKKPQRPLIWHLFPSYLIIVILAVTAVAWIALHVFQQFLYEETADDLIVRAQMVASRIGDDVVAGHYQQVDQLCRQLGSTTSTRITIILADGRVIADSNESPENMENHFDRPEVLAARNQGVGRSRRYSYTLKQSMMYVAIPFESDQRLMAFIRTAVPLTAISKTFQSVTTKMLLGGILIACLAAGISLLVARQLSKPLVEMKKGAEKFAKGELQLKLDVPSSEEMGSLAITLNDMARQLDERIRTVIIQRQERDAVLASMIEGVIAVDKQEKLIHVNQSAGELFSIPFRGLKGKTMQEVVRNSELYQFMQSVLESEEPLASELVFYEQGERTMYVNGTQLRDETGSIIGALLVINDITHLKKLESIRREFVANVSHELKTPITLVQGFVETLLDGAIDNKQEATRFLNKILDNSKRLNAIIEDLLNLSRIEQSGEEDLEKETIKLRQLLENVALTCSTSAKQKKMTIEVQCASDIELAMNTSLMEQALINLVDNALKYSQSKEPVLLLGRQSNDEIQIEVKDYGIGILSDHKERLFERFYRVDKARSRSAGGTGLGLAIVKHIVQAHGGIIHVESELQKGTSFIIQFPRSV